MGGAGRVRAAGARNGPDKPLATSSLQLSGPPAGSSFVQTASSSRVPCPVVSLQRSADEVQLI